MTTFNEKIYKETILGWIPDIDPNDLKFLCNKSASIYQDNQKQHWVRNYRVKRILKDDKPNFHYDEAIKRHCCKAFDVQVSNPITNNIFSIGFNLCIN